MGERLKDSKAERIRCLSENERLKKKMHDIDAENSELRRRLLAADKYKDQLREAKYAAGKLEYKIEKLQDRMEAAKDQLAQCKLDMLNVKSYVVSLISRKTIYCFILFFNCVKSE